MPLTILALAASMASAADTVFAVKTFPKNQVVSMIVHADSGRIGVVGRDGDVKVEALQPAGSKGKCELLVELKKGVLDIHARSPQNAGMKGCDAGFSVTMPPRVTLEASTGSGDIAAENLRNGAKLRTGSGNVRVAGVSGQIHVLTGSGDVSLALSAKKGGVSVVTGSGHVALAIAKEAQAVFTLSSASGKIVNPRPSVAEAALKIIATTGSGDVTIR